MLKLYVNFEQVLDEWLFQKEKNIKQSSYYKYEFIINNKIKPFIGKILFKKINNEDIVNLFEKKDIITLSDSTKNLILVIINSTLKFGIEKNYRRKLPKIKVTIKQPKSRIVYLTKKEQNILEQYIYNNLNLRNLSILLDLYTGLRLGELCALQWKDIDFINNIITVSKSVKRIKNNDLTKKNKTELLIDTPKSNYSIRIVPIPKFIISLLKKYYTDDDYFIFTNSLFPKDPRTLEKYFKSLLKKCNIRDMVFHSLRHTYATRSREAGIDIKILSELLGHSSYKITLDIYVHTSLEFKKASVNSLVKYLNPKSS